MPALMTRPSPAHRQAVCWLLVLFCTGSWLAVAATFAEERGQPGELQSHRRLLGHVQSGPDTQGNSYVSASYVDPDSQTLHIVGTTYGTWWGSRPGGYGNLQASSKKVSGDGGLDSACFYAVAQLGGRSFRWIHTEMMGKPSVEEGCTDFLLDTERERLYIVGHSDTDGLLEDFFDNGELASAGTKQVGLILGYQLNSDGTGKEQPLVLEGGRLIQQSPVTYPVAIAGLPPFADRFFVASSASQDTTVNPNWHKRELDPSEYFHYGSSYFVKIRSFKKNSPNDLQNALPNIHPGSSLLRSVSPGFEKQLSTDLQDDVYISALVELPDRLLLAGYTQGTGVGFSFEGAAVDQGNMDGFVTQLGLVDLNPLGNGIKPTLRISSGRDDYVTGACFSVKSPHHFYVTGYSKGHVLSHGDTAQEADHQSTRGYIMKVQLQDLETVWIREIEAEPGAGQQHYLVQAMSCAVTSDGDNVYVTGNVHNGGAVRVDTQYVTTNKERGAVNNIKSLGGNDVWVAQIANNENDGNVVFLRQFGSDGTDSVAFRGGLQVDAQDNAIVIGNTHGSVYRDREKHAETNNQFSDVFLSAFVLNTGAHVLPVDHHDFVSLPPTPSPAPHTARPSGKPVTAENVPTAPQENGSDDDEDPFPIYSMLLMFAIIGVLLMCCGRLVCFWKGGGGKGSGGGGGDVASLLKRDAPTDRSKVLSYLHDFDVEDIELKHSATSGWHCTYMNDLARGKNNHESQYNGSSSSYHRGSGTGRRLGSVGGDDDYEHGAYDPLTPRGNGGGGDLDEEGERFSDEILSMNSISESDDAVTFGSSRIARRTRGGGGGGSGNHEGLFKSASFREKRNPNMNESLFRTASYRQTGKKHRSRSSSSNSSGGNNSERTNRAKERWQNREII